MNSSSGFNLEKLLDHIADRVAEKLAPRLNEKCAGTRSRLLSVTEAAQYLGRTKASVQHLIAAGTIPVVRSDRRTFLDVRELDRWIDANRKGL